MFNYRALSCLRINPSLKHVSITQSRLCSKTKGTSSSNTTDKSDEEKSREEAKVKLQNLLNKIVSESFADKKTINITHAVKRVTEKRPVYGVKMNKIKDQHVAKMVSAVKDVADDIGGDVRQTEAELLHVLLNNQKPDKLTPDKTVSLKELMSSMRVEKEDDPKRMVGRSNQIQQALSAAGKLRKPYGKEATSTTRLENRVNLFGNPPLGIFTTTFEPKPADYTLDTWTRLEQKELKLMVTHPPQNIYEEMIQWTEQGKLWHLPVDNEQGLEEEKKIDFTEHVFLDEHLEPWCPERGPLRHFMELVLVGLSKNPYITVEAKKDHIFWFRDYFEEKKKLLLEVGAFGDQQKSIEEKTKTIE